MSSKVKLNFFDKVKITVELLQHERRFQDFIEWSFTAAKDNIEVQTKNNTETQKSFYPYAALIWENAVHTDFGIHFPKISSYDQIKKKPLSYELPPILNFLNTFDAEDFDDFLENLKDDKEIKSNLLPMFLSPLAINFFHNSFTEAIQNSKTSLSNAMEDSSHFLTSFNNNMCYCPDYLIKFFQQDDDYFDKLKIKPTQIIHEYILKIFFLHPKLFGIEKELKISESYQNQITDDLSFNLSFFFKDYKNMGFKILQKKENESNAFDPSSSVVMNSDFDNNFRQLLKISPKLPDHLPKKYESNEEIIKDFVVRPGPQFFKRESLFRKMEMSHIDEHSRPKINKMYERSLESMVHIHESDAIAKLNKIIINFSHAQDITKEITGYYIQKYLDLILDKDKIKQRDPFEYINNPQHFISDIQKARPEQQKEIITPINIFKNFIQSINFNVFTHLRKEIITTDRSLDTIIQSYRFHKFETYIQDLKNQDKKSYEKLVNKFDMAFSDSTDPLKKAKQISNAYLEIVKKIKSDLGRDVNKLEERERQNFIFSIFCLMRPAKIMSVYVFLYEFIFNPKCIQLFKDQKNQDELADIQSAHDILISLFTFCSKMNIAYGTNGLCLNYLYQAANLCRMCHKSVDLVVKKDENELEKLAILSDPDIENYESKEGNESFVVKSRIEYFRKIDTSKRITLYIYVNEDNFLIFNISFSDDANIKPLPIEKKDMINLVKEQENNDN